MRAPIGTFVSILTYIWCFACVLCYVLDRYLLVIQFSRLKGGEIYEQTTIKYNYLSIKNPKSAPKLQLNSRAFKSATSLSLPYQFFSSCKTMLWVPERLVMPVKNSHSVVTYDARCKVSRSHVALRCLDTCMFGFADRLAILHVLCLVHDDKIFLYTYYIQSYILK